MQRDITTISTLRFTRNIHLGDIGAPLNFCEEMDPSVDNEISVIETDDEIGTSTSAVSVFVSLNVILDFDHVICFSYMGPAVVEVNVSD